MAGKKSRPSLSAMEEFDLETKIQKATHDGIKSIATKESTVDSPPPKKLSPKEVTPSNKKAQRGYIAESKNKKPLGRPKKNPYADEKKLTIRMPEKLHRQLRFASADTGKPMVEIAIDALIQYLSEYEQQ